MNDAVRNSVNSGVFYSIAAGNDGAKACAYSPASAGRTWNGSRWIYDNGIMTVAATNKQDGETSWSNYGDCIDIWAPGYSILSTKRGGGTTTMSGTSMAAPHVGGGGALYLSTHASTSPVDVEMISKANAVSTGTQSKDDRQITRLYARDF
jgi:subtilisin family serine protease